MSEVFNFTIPGNPGYLQMVKLAIGSIACTANFCVEQIEDIKIAVGEGFKNICCHGFDGWSNTIEIVCEMKEDAMIIEITDADCKHEREKTKRPCLDCPKEGDLAIHVIRSIMDDVEFTKAADGNKSIKMVKNRC